MAMSRRPPAHAGLSEVDLSSRPARGELAESPHRPTDQRTASGDEEAQTNGEVDGTGLKSAALDADRPAADLVRRSYHCEL